MLTTVLTGGKLELYSNTIQHSYITAKLSPITQSRPAGGTASACLILTGGAPHYSLLAIPI